MNPLVSIIIPCYNADDFIERAIAKATEQTYPYTEIIVVDDGSNAQTKSVLQRLESKIDLLLSQENKGQGTARNLGIKHAKGSYVLNWDADDWFEPTFIEKAVSIFEEQGQVAIVTCDCYRTDEKSYKEYLSPDGGSLANFLFTNSALGSSMFRMASWEECGGYDESETIRGFEDWEFYIRLLLSGGQAIVINEPLFHYIRHPQTTTRKIQAQKLEKRAYIYKKHKALYTDHYDLLIDDFVARIAVEQREKIKNTERIDYKLGAYLLKPLRALKKVLR